MNLVLLLLIFLFIRLSYSKCKKYDFKLQLEPNDCVCNDLSDSPKGRIFNGTNLDRRDLLYVASLYTEFKEKKICQLHLLKDYFIFFKLIFYHKI